MLNCKNAFYFYSIKHNYWNMRLNKIIKMIITRKISKSSITVNCSLTYRSTWACIETNI